MLDHAPVHGLEHISVKSILSKRRNKMARVFEITDKEQAMIDAWAKTGKLSAAAKILDIPQSTMSNRKSRLQWRYKRAKDFCRQVERQMARLPGALE